MKDLNIVARMDTDDISVYNRFEKQIKVFQEKKDIDACSSWISEFENDENKIISYRKVPESNLEIIKFSKMRSPLNHAVTMYKKSVVVKAGGYLHMLSMEDYYLWARMIMNGAKFYNLQVPLLNVRAGNILLQRRGGFKYVKMELNLLSEFKKIGFLTTEEYLKNLILKVPIRLMPKSILKVVYRFLRTKRI